MPGPAIGFLQEALRWFDHWLKGRDTGIMDEPKLRVWMQEHVPPAVTACRAARPLGRRGGVAVVRDRRARSLPLGARGLGLADADDAALRAPLLERHGLDAGTWCPYGALADEPGDQREEDAPGALLHLGAAHGAAGGARRGRSPCSS